MSDNFIAKLLKGAGIGIMIVGGISAIIVGKRIDNSAIIWSGIIGSIISGLMTVGFSEIIDLLQQNADNQSEIIRQLKRKPASNNTEDESRENKYRESSAQIAIPVPKHVFRCEKCGEMIEDYPCPHCGKNSE